MNFLQLCQKLRQEVGGSGSGPSTVLNQAGENLLYVSWIHDAWLDIQNSRDDWNFLWAQSSFQLEPSKQIYTLDQDLKSIAKNSVRVDGNCLLELKYSELRNVFSVASSSRPSYFCILPNGELMVNSLPDKSYVTTLDYYKKPQELLNNIDVPLLPKEFHLLIIYEAMLSYGSYENASEVYQRARIKYDQLVMDVERSQLPQIELAGPLA